jgi:hypothetical protein
MVRLECVRERLESNNQHSAPLRFIETESYDFIFLQQRDTHSNKTVSFCPFESVRSVAYPFLHVHTLTIRRGRPPFVAAMVLCSMMSDRTTTLFLRATGTAKSREKCLRGFRRVCVTSRVWRNIKSSTTASRRDQDTRSILWFWRVVVAVVASRRSSYRTNCAGCPSALESLDALCYRLFLPRFCFGRIASSL